MFNLREFVKINLLTGHRNGSFSREQTNIFAANYLLKGILTEQDVIDIDTATAPIEE